MCSYSRSPTGVTRNHALSLPQGEATSVLAFFRLAIGQLISLLELLHVVISGVRSITFVRWLDALHACGLALLCITNL